MKGPVLDRVEDTIRRFRMFSQGDAVGVAVSGGRDSVCLLHLLSDLAKVWALRLFVLHVHHRLRPESDAELEFVESLAAKLGWPCVAERIALESGNLEESAREARLEFFARQVRIHDLKTVATGHTRSDQAETVLFRLLRGSGTTGLRGIAPKFADGKICRPLLDCDRADVDTWLVANGLEWRDDPSNATSRFARNRIRHDLLPMLARDWNPRIVETLARTAEVAAAEDDYLEQITDDFWRSASTHEPDGSVVLTWEAPPAAIARRLVRRAIREIKGDTRQIGFEHVEAVLKMAGDGNGHGRVILPGVDVIRSFNWLRFAVARIPSDETRNWSVPLTIPTQVDLPGGGLVTLADLPLGCDYNEREFRLGLSNNRKSLILRNWRPGDVLALPSRRDVPKVKDLFQEWKIPLWERRNWPVIVEGESLLWAGEFGSAAEGVSEENSPLFVKLTRSGRAYRPFVNQSGGF